MIVLDSFAVRKVWVASLILLSTVESFTIPLGNADSLAIQSRQSFAGVGPARQKSHSGATRTYDASSRHQRSYSQQQTRNILYQSASNGIAGPNDNDQPNRNSAMEQKSTSASRLSRISIINAALLIAGTTVGGGFLALPTVVAPTGFFPAACTLTGVWAFLGIQSLCVVESLLHALQRRLQNQQSTNGSKSENTDYNPGVAAAAQSALGKRGETLVVALLVTLMEATLVSQISRAGTLLGSSTGGYRASCALSALSVAALVFSGPTRRLVPFFNSALTIVFCIVAFSLFQTGAPAADWSRLAHSSNWSAVGGSLPTFLQLLVYAEILPTVCRMLQYQIQPIRWAILLGSFLPLGLEVGWAALGMGLVPLGTKGDPVDVLLASGPVQQPLLVLAIAAILTTIIGTYLALQSTANDLWAKVHNKASELKENVTPWKQNMAEVIAIVIPALAIACISPTVFLRAIDFAGSYPVLLLWGILPPVLCLSQRQRGSTSVRILPGVVLWSSLALSMGLFLMFATPDLAFLVGKLKSLFQ